MPKPLKAENNSKKLERTTQLPEGKLEQVATVSRPQAETQLEKSGFVQTEVKFAARTFSTVIPIPSPRAEADMWRHPEDAVANQWYVAIYFSDKVPYLAIWDKRLWRDNRGLPVAVPMRIKAVGEFPKQPKTPKKDSE